MTGVGNRGIRSLVLIALGLQTVLSSIMIIEDRLFWATKRKRTSNLVADTCSTHFPPWSLSLDARKR